jgi:hypothetical protein
MKSNVLRFPKELTTNSEGGPTAQALNVQGPKQASDMMVEMNDLDLMRLREAFDKARQEWPEEEAELPEKNKIHSIL